MIPKVIHYCWFGGNPKSDLILHCLDSWKQHLPDYEFIEWDETKFPPELHHFTNEAYKMNYYAFVSDYVRAHALYTQGGIYLDTDVELKGSLDPFLTHPAFSGFEKKGLPFTAVWGSEKSHTWPKKVLEMYDNSSFDGVSLVPNTSLVSEILEADFEIDPEKDELQIGKDGVAIYPSSMFCLDIPHNVATHHFEGSWLEESDRKNYKYWINRDWRADVLVNSIAKGDLDSTLGNLFRRIGPGKVVLSLVRIAIKTVALQLKRTR